MTSAQTERSLEDRLDAEGYDFPAFECDGEKGGDQEKGGRFDGMQG